MRAAIDEADRLLATFNALLNIAEAESGARRNQAEPLDLALTARAAAELYEPVAEEKGCALKLDVEPGIMIRFGDRHLLSQAIANLLDNAFKYGGGEVRAVRAPAGRPRRVGGVRYRPRDPGRRARRWCSTNRAT